MRCRKCQERAVYNMRQHKLALCKKHYLEWFLAQTEKTIHSYQMFNRSDPVLVAVSGGKDSLALWDCLWQLGYKADGLYIDLGIDGEGEYSKRCREAVERFAKERGLHLYIESISERYGKSLPELADRSFRGKDKPCSVCGLVKRYVMNRAALEHGYQVVATGHNLDDEVAVLLSNVLSWQVGYLARQGPVLLEREGLARKVKPLVRFYERDTTAYSLLRGIKYIYDECPFAQGATSIEHKQLLSQLEDRRPGTKLRFYLGFLQLKEENFFQAAQKEAEQELHPCESCGQPTTAPGYCAFCRLITRAGA